MASPARRVSDDEVLSEGTGVDVRTRFDGRWARGFEVASVRLQGAAPPAYRIRRRSDHRVLPGFFPENQLRTER
jgi:hypothetical protein